MTTEPEQNPVGIVYGSPDTDHRCLDAASPTATWYRKHLEGRWYRVMPTRFDEIFFLQGLVSYSERCAPGFGHGLLICETAWKNFRQFLMSRGRPS